MTPMNGNPDTPDRIDLIHPDKMKRYLKTLSAAYDELLEFNLTTGRFQLLYSVSDKYVIPPMQGETVALLRDFVDPAVHPDDRAKVLDFFQRLTGAAPPADGRTGASFEFRRTLRDGGYHWVSASFRPVADSAEDICLFYLIDIQRRKQSEEHAEMLRDIFSATVTNDYQAACIIQLDTQRYHMYYDRSSGYHFPKEGPYEQLVSFYQSHIYVSDLEHYRQNMSLDGVRRRLANGQTSIQFRSLVSGCARWTENRLIYFRGDSNLVLSTMRDVHESHLVEEKIRNFSEKYLRSFGRIYSNILEVDPQSGQAEVLKSSSMPQHNNQTLDYGVVLDWAMRMIHETDIPLVRRDFSLAGLREFLQNGQGQKTLEVRWKKTQQTYEWAELSAFSIPDPAQGTPRILLSVRDTNEQHLLRSIVDRFVYNNCDYFIYLNANEDSYVMFSGADNGTPLPPTNGNYSAVMARCAADYVVPEDCARVTEQMRLKTVLRALENNAEHVIYYGVQDPALGYTRKRLQFTYYDKPNQMLLLTRSDVTHMYREEQRKNNMLARALEDAKAGNLAKTEFLSRMSHDIRTPMNAIVGMTAIAAAQVGNREKVMDCLAKINTSSRYLMALLGDILDMSKLESGKLRISREPFDFTHMLSDISSMTAPQAAENNLHLGISATAAVAPRYSGDQIRISQILMNLLSNSLKFTPPGGNISLEIDEVERNGDTARLRMRVSDTGCGMSETFLNNIYQPFEQEGADIARDQAGSGLGLTIVHSLVQLMDGTISVRSKLGEGTVFTVDLPVGTVSGTEDANAVPSEFFPAAAARPRDASGTLFHGERVLLVEDNELNTEIAKSLLEMDGLSVDTAADGKQAVTAFEEAASGMYAAILMDIRMPVMNGLDAARAIRTLKKADAGAVPIIAMSAGAYAEDREDALGAGMNEYLTKPVEVEKLRNVLQNYIRN